ncbi:NUDIX domain-containing protein [Moraxella sp. VT-16-12]|uniref:NUDIX domain-containing protein n=1 Tax=Moraxella sp. VT-16-12 TaxID=2014877 RepID=UPI001648BF72|nr:NUDIX domain-containing protein [Moraxella sp. VT-16-12]
MTINGKMIDVAVAVLRFGDEFLLATRHSHQHQGGKLEFVGGKIEQGESPKSALIREVKEELGLDVAGNTITKLGRICHDYGDKMVRLYVHQVWLDDGQYLDFKDKNIGLDGQAIAFYDKSSIFSQTDNFPTANKMILTWLTLPLTITISHVLSHFGHKNDWLDYYQHLPKASTLLIRTQADVSTNAQLIQKLSIQRDDLCFILSLQDVKTIDTSRILAIRLTHNELLALDLSAPNLPNLPIIASCHDEHSINKANALAKIYPVMAVLLSPVQLTATHPDTPCLGWERFGELADMADVPVIGLGGLSPDDLPMAWRFGAVVVAGIRAFGG